MSLLIITGPPRSGTSLMASLCVQCGSHPGGAPHPNQALNAGWEDREIQQINKMLLDGNTKRIGKRIKGYSRKVCKDPRFVFKGSIPLLCWRVFRKDFRVLLLLRDPDSVVRSMSAHPDHFTSVPTVENVATMQGLCKYACRTASIPLQMLQFPQYVEQPDEVYKALTHFGRLKITKEKFHAAWKNIVDPAKIRYG